MINKKNFNKWLAALRSGKFPQGRRFLYDSSSNTFCCLGVVECLHLNLKPHQKVKIKHTLRNAGHPSKSTIETYLGIAYNSRAYNVSSENSLLANIRLASVKLREIFQEKLPHKFDDFQTWNQLRTYIRITELNDAAILNLTFEDIATILEEYFKEGEQEDEIQ